MHFLVIINSRSELEASVNYASRLASETDELTLLAIIPASGEIPLRPNGQILDQCTEYDLRPLLVEQTVFREAIETLPKRNTIQFEVLIGDRTRIVKDRVKSISPDLLLVATELTTDVKDKVFQSHASQLFGQIDLPVLTYKCDRSREELNHIALVSDFERLEKDDLNVLKEILNSSGASLSLFSVISEESQRESQLQLIKRFEDFHELEDTQRVVITSTTKETTIRELTSKFEMQLMVLMDLHRHGIGSALFGDLERDIMNHTAVPILAC